MTLDTSNFTGTENYYRHSLSKVLYTDGVQYVAAEAGAFWLLDEIAVAQSFNAKVRGEEFQVWKLDVKGSTATLRCEDGNGRKLLAKRIDFTTFPEPGIEIWVEVGERPVMLLPSEH
jgi:hypothetical protein